ncbi:MAG: phage virion morphogenesis protein [Shewanella sp. CG18_big_fil_WC_8_21_14_2_50_42_11]|uniref:phage virion morphogenesis protein n=1 Tax=Shewanella sp. CG18_big_fil_WC_8_21_14_2_50_42_11 TaxID=1975538 RepID=UPI000C466417|nr:phage virion morphogenesis protein [Shewanella sp. CG18_big_fil_WC_8_21_14_2_50_42_11]PIP98543.1 MAG: phage virion morphogenesis protein [Shewanella sp. CG18_big_fil_WC_8_21_14_2_50_42_11]
MTGITVEVDDKAVRKTLSRLSSFDLAAALRGIGETLTNNTRERLENGVDVDGRHFAPLSPVTLARKKKNRDKVLMESGDLHRELAYQLVHGGTSLEFGSDRKYAAVHQFGAKQGAFGRSNRNGPLPWGNIPARPFIGISTQDHEEILDNLSVFIENQLNAK